MKYLTLSALVMLLILAIGGELRAQDSELGDLPPMPNLNLGDPDTKLSWNQKRLRAQIIARERRIEEEEAKSKAPPERPRPPLAQRLSDQTKKAPTSQAITVRNSLPYGEDGITSSGSRLRPFGDDNYWGPMAEPTPEESLALLPPIPDLRVPDQVTKKERLRDSLVARQAVRKAEADAAREKSELMQRAIVNRPVADPSTALVQVQSPSESAGYVGNQAAPETVHQGRTLKPFNENSTYTQGSQIIYKGSKGNAPSGGLFGRKAPKP